MPFTFSIVTPSYQQGEYLAQTIESVLGQAGDFRIDYIVIDGGSQDGSVEIIRKYDELLKNGEWPVACRGITYRWVSETDSGQSDAIMKGFAKAEGEILAWLNSDDTYLPGALQAVADAFEAGAEPALVYGDADYTDTYGAVLGKYRTDDFDIERLACYNIICQPSAFFTHEAFRKVGGLDTSLTYAMDFDLWIRLGRRFPCLHMPKLLSTYRLHDSSKTVREETLYENSEEALHLALKYFDWAPLTRVYNSCNSWCRSHLPLFLSQRKGLLVAVALAFSIIRSLYLNRGIRRKDMKLLNGENFSKLAKERIDIMTRSKTQ